MKNINTLRRDLHVRIQSIVTKGYYLRASDGLLSTDLVSAPGIGGIQDELGGCCLLGGVLQSRRKHTFYASFRREAALELGISTSEAYALECGFEGWFQNSSLIDEARRTALYDLGAELRETYA